MHTRRELLAIAAGLAAGRLYAGNSDFWNKKDPSEWSSQEIEQLTTKSPWSKEVAASVPAEYGRRGGPSVGSGGGPGSPPVGGPIPGVGGIGGIGGIGGMGGGRPAGGGGRNPVDSFKGTIRWESAKPMLDAMKSRVPEAFTNHYVISVSGIPLSGRYGRSEDEDTNLDRLKGVTFLEPRGKRDLQPGIVQQQASSTGSVLFGFSKEMLMLTENDKEVLFSTTFGRVNLKAKFVLKDMMYHGQLAV
ncbi:MAG: hypothetical protein LAO79_14045 [Acidobacteriia bacterium]|nr:hypothetical protein [Terriglobia bacterium]